VNSSGVPLSGKKQEKPMSSETREKIRPYVLQPGEGETLENLRLRIVATNALTGGQLMAAECVNPGPGGPPLHTHTAHDEMYFVLQGRYRFKLGDDEQEGGPGTFVYVPRGTAHAFASVGPEEGRLFAVSLPGLEGFLEQMSAELEAGDADQQDLTQLFHAYHSEIDGPPLM
jgi:mannose-6-phosphate isomerase-like protein (cupin superfamily)